MASPVARVLRNSLVLLVALVAALLVLHAFVPTRFGERAVTAALRPVQLAVARLTPHLGTSPSGPGASMETVVRLQIENAKLREALDIRESEEGFRRFLDARNLAGVNAYVLGRSADGDTNVLVLSAGSERGIQRDEPVIAEDGVLIGTILTAQQGRSTVLLLTHPRSTVGVEVQNAARSPGIVSGQHGLSLRMRLIPQGEQVDTGAAVVTAPVDEHIPPNLLVGEVTEVHFQTGDLFQEATIRPLVDYQRLRSVNVLLSKP